ncbi:MAG: phosphoribosylanthranilate isomerase [Hyphomicrobiaceae bacterium]|nr:phosphoribosylanthranilate isomerase [Hyphomicrobiaceae bacterium]
MKTQVKVCGLKTFEMIDVAVEAGASMVGFMHFAKSPRHVGVDDLVELVSYARGRAETVVILVNPDNSLVAEIAASDPDFLQLHGSEPPERIEAIRLEGGIPVMKAVPIGDADDLNMVFEYDEVADRLLLDAKPPKTATRPGGLGRTFDWSLLKALDPGLEFMLSGGLTPDNVQQAIRQVNPWGVDVSSGVESAPGVKDPDLIRRFIAAVESA